MNQDRGNDGGGFLLLMGIFIIVVCLMLFDFTKSTLENLGYKDVGNEEIELKVIESYKIVKGNSKTEIHGYGSSFLTMGRMKIDSEDKFVFYFENKKGEIQRKKVDPNFTIKEVEGNESYYKIYRKIYKQKKCKLDYETDEYSDCKIKEHEGFGTVKKLFIPKGSIKDNEFKFE